MPAQPGAASCQQCPQSASCVGRVRKLSLSCLTLPPPQLQAPSDLNGQSHAATAEAADACGVARGLLAHCAPDQNQARMALFN